MLHRTSTASGVLAAALFIVTACSSFSDGDDTAPASVDGGADVAIIDANPPSNEASTVDPPADGPSPPKTYRDMILADAPLAYWRMGAVTGSVVPDETMRGNELSLSGSSYVTTGVPGAIPGDNAVSFDGTVNGFAEPESSLPFVFAGVAPFSVEVWIRPVATAGEDTFEDIVSYVDGISTNNTQNGFSLYLDHGSSPGIYAEYGSAPGGSVRVRGLGAANDVWSHIVMTFDGSLVKLYVDSALQGSVNSKGPLGPRTSPALKIARSSAFASNSYGGALDEVAIYARALDAPTIAKHFAAAAPQ